MTLPRRLDPDGRARFTVNEFVPYDARARSRAPARAPLDRRLRPRGGRGARRASTRSSGARRFLPSRRARDVPGRRRGPRRLPRTSPSPAARAARDRAAARASRPVLRRRGDCRCGCGVCSASADATCRRTFGRSRSTLWRSPPRGPVALDVLARVGEPAADVMAAAPAPQALGAVPAANGGGRRRVREGHERRPHHPAQPAARRVPGRAHPVIKPGADAHRRVPLRARRSRRSRSASTSGARDQRRAGARRADGDRGRTRPPRASS